MFELHNPQMVMYYIEKIGAGQACLMCGSLLLPRTIPESELQHAANEVFRINDGLRTRFVEKDGKVWQEYAPYAERTFEVKRFDSREALDEWGSVYATIPLKLDIRSEGAGVPKSTWKRTAPSMTLVKNVALHEAKMYFTKRRYGMLHREPACCEIILIQLPGQSGAIIKMHHVIADGWTVMLAANHFVAVLNGETPQTYSYEEYIQSELAYRSSPRYEKDKRFFAEQLRRCPEPTWVWPSPYTSLEARRRTVEMDESLSRGIVDYARAHGVTPYTLFLTAVCVFMGRKMRREQFYVGTVVSNRAGYRQKNTAGMFVNSAPLLMELRDGDRFADALAHVRGVSYSGFRHQKGSNSRDTKQFLYDVWVSYQNMVLSGDEAAECKQYYCNYTIDTTIFTIEDHSGKGRYNLHFDYNVKVPEADVDELFRTVLGVLRGGIEDDSRPLGQLGR